eukprot:50101-Rhodomonas_salina.1
MDAAALIEAYWLSPGLTLAVASGCCWRRRWRWTRRQKITGGHTCMSLPGARALTWMGGKDAEEVNTNAKDHWQDEQKLLVVAMLERDNHEIILTLPKRRRPKRKGGKANSKGEERCFGVERAMLPGRGCEVQTDEFSSAGDLPSFEPCTHQHKGGRTRIASQQRLCLVLAFRQSICVPPKHHALGQRAQSCTPISMQVGNQEQQFCGLSTCLSSK